MKKFIILLLVCTGFSIVSRAQLLNVKEEKPNTTGLHFIERFDYLPLPGTETADKTKLATESYKTNQIIEYNEAGRIMSVMDYERGSKDVTNSTKRFYWEGRKLLKEVQENAAGEEVYTVSYTYNAAGNEMKSVTKSGPAGQMAFIENESTESIYTDGKLTKFIRRNDKDEFRNSRTYTYDSKGMVIKEEYTNQYNTAVKTFAWDSKGNKIKEADLDKDGNPKYVWERQYDQAGRMTKSIGTEYYQGKKQGERIMTITYDSHGAITNQVDADNGTTNIYSYKHTYDARGNLLQTVSLKNGKVEDVEVRNLLYYRKN